jgi:protein-S-isoprenylcysteine O-methyltransferase Ste14
MHPAWDNGNWNWIQHDPPMLAAMVLWCVFSIYWEIEAKNSSPAAVSESRPSRWLHLLLINAGQLLLFFEVRGLGRRYLPASTILVATGLAMLAMGVLLAVWARRCLGRNWSGEITIKVEHQLVRNGPYRVLRHPIYTALLSMYAGTALVSGELHALIGLVLAVLAYLRKVRKEEANLMKAFGTDYSDYRGGTWALIPWLY